MSAVKQAIDGHAAYQFEQYMRELITASGFSSVQEYTQAAGVSNSANFYHILKAKAQTISPLQAKRWAKPLGLSPEELMAKYPTRSGRGPRRKSKGRAVIAPVSEPVPTRREPVAEAASKSERFSMTVNADGTASIWLDLPDLPLAVALKLVQALELPGLIGPRLRITHTPEENKS
jgi:hypothetical protein